MWSVARAACLVAAGLLAGTAHAGEIRILVIGGALASNCNAHAFQPAAGVYQLGLDGAEKPAGDPFDWADCQGGAQWVPLGEALLRLGRADRVVFLPVGVQRARAADWLTDSPARTRLQAALAMARAHHMRFDYALWQQGMADAGTPRSEHATQVDAVIKSINRQVRIGKWLIARQSGCAGQPDPDISSAQLQAARDPLHRRFPGPDVDALGAAYRVDGCRLNRAGQEEMARRWVRAMGEADAEYTRYQKESLLHYFR
ncbi:hypothetical protein GCM10007918_58290 [Piscinibacter gummiphilus]|uniref:hypothetical protein n=1 Tax=Piscinibacter gummiphilus TaxID=946333 RepID=UPI0012F4C50B|nr:hypothetical protein [Piscinibacter gummiphilus]GLS98537.1 hypothetical protein GCM10007918_58290 [Piscinibacter gummiphilus]